VLGRLRFHGLGLSVTLGGLLQIARSQELLGQALATALRLEALPPNNSFHQFRIQQQIFTVFRKLGFLLHLQYFLLAWVAGFRPFLVLLLEIIKLVVDEGS